MSSAVNVLRNSLIILDLTIKGVFQLNLYHNNETIV